VAVVYALGFETGLMLLAAEPRVFARLEELYLDFYEEHYAWASQAGYAGGHMVDSYSGTDTISPEVYRDWVAPIHRQCADMIHRHGLLADLYIPGHVMPILEHLAGQGWDALRIEDTCKSWEQDIGEARRILGDEQCLFGNMSAYALLRGDWEEIRLRAKYQHDAAGRTGPFIISNGSGIPDRTDPHIVDRWIEYACELASR
jgi:uroporphyrinogen-III decarboxylase